MLKGAPLNPRIFCFGCMIVESAEIGRRRTLFASARSMMIDVDLPLLVDLFPSDSEKRYDIRPRNTKSRADKPGRIWKRLKMFAKSDRL